MLVDVSVVMMSNSSAMSWLVLAYMTAITFSNLLDLPTYANA